jgi:exosortase
MKPACGIRTAWILAIGGIALAVSGLAAVATLASFWGSNSENADRFLILVAFAWLVWRLRPELPNSRGNILGLLPLLAGCLAPVPAWYLYGQVGPKVILIWWLAGAWVLAAFGAVLLLGGWRWLRLFAFPLAFLLLALPMPRSVELPLQNNLKHATTYLAEAGLRASGMTVSRQEFELYLPSGGLEVVEACSGVRSVTALLAIAVFVSHLRGFGLLRGLLMLGLALPLIAAVNALRIMLTGWIQEGFGKEWVQGTPHELLGVMMVLVGLAMVLMISQFMRPREVKASAVNSMPLLFSGVPAASLAVLIAALGTGGSAYAYLAGYARVDHLAQTAPLEKVPLIIGNWNGEDQPIDEEVCKTLTYDRAILRIYRDQFGHEIEVWVIFWEASSSITGYHHPDVCFPNRGFAASLKSRRNVDLSGGRELPVTIRHFKRETLEKFVTYWTQEGRHVFSEDDDNNADKGGPGHNWVRDRLVEHPPEVSSRLSVLISTVPSTEQMGREDRVDAMTAEFARQLAEQLFELCPWADMKR